MRKSILLAVVAGILASPANTANWFEFDSANHCDIDIASIRPGSEPTGTVLASLRCKALPNLVTQFEHTCRNNMAAYSMS